MKPNVGCSNISLKEIVLHGVELSWNLRRDDSHSITTNKVSRSVCQKREVGAPPPQGHNIPQPLAFGFTHIKFGISASSLSTKQPTEKAFRTLSPISGLRNAHLLTGETSTCMMGIYNHHSLRRGHRHPPPNITKCSLMTSSVDLLVARWHPL